MNVEKKQPYSRGIPSAYALYLPAYYSDEVPRFQDSNENLLRNVWSIDEIVNFVFPAKYQPTYHTIASSFLSLLFSRGKLNREEVVRFIKEKGISKATFYNKIFPKLRKLGMIKWEKKTGEVRVSRIFANYLMKIADSWLAHVDEIRARK